MSETLLLLPNRSKSAGNIEIIPPDEPVIEINTLSLTLPVPGGSTINDALIALISTDADPTLTAPAGWVLEDSIGGTAKSFIYYKISDGSEPATYTWDLDGAQDAAGAIILVKDVNTQNLINAKVEDFDTGSVIQIPPITTTNRNTMLITLISLNDGVLVDASDLKKSKRTGLWVVNTSGQVVGSVGSSADYKKLRKSGTEPEYSLNTVGDISTDYYSIQIAINPKGTDLKPSGAISFAGNRGNIQTTPIGTTLVLTVATANITVGQYAFLIASTTGIGINHISLVDTQGNSWTKIASIGNQPSPSIWYALITTELVSGVDTLTLTVDSTTTKVMSLHAFNGTNLVVESFAGNGGTSSVSTVTLSSLANREHLLIGMVGRNGTTDFGHPEDPDYTQMLYFGFEDEALSQDAAYRIATLTTDIYSCDWSPNQGWSTLLAALW